MELIEFGSLTPAFRAQLEGDEEDPFDGARSTLTWRPKDHHVGLRSADGPLLASAGFLVTEVAVAGERFPVVGIGGVIVNAAHRGRGLARRVVEAALERARALGPDLAVLFCHDDRAGLYRKLGFATVQDRVVVRQDDGWTVMPMNTMWRALQQGASWPPGPVEVLGPPF